MIVFEKKFEIDESRGSCLGLMIIIWWRLIMVICILLGINGNERKILMYVLFVLYVVIWFIMMNFWSLIDCNMYRFWYFGV